MIDAKLLKQFTDILDAKPSPVLSNINHNIARAQQWGFVYTQALNQKRSGTSDPAWYHLWKAAEIVTMLGLGQGYIQMAWLHDIIEDSGITRDDIFNSFSAYVADGVDKLTAYPDPTKSRKERYAEYHAKLATAGYGVQTVKLAESLVNIYEVHNSDKSLDFIALWLDEKEDFYHLATDAHPVMRSVYWHFLLQANETLGRRTAKQAITKRAAS